MKKILFIILLFQFSVASAQEPWSYQVWFNLFTKNGARVTPEMLKSKEYEIFVTNDALHIASFLNYNSEANCFVLIQRTISKTETILLVHERDTAIVKIPTKTFYAKDFRITQGFYNIALDKNGEDLAETNVQDIFPNRRIYSCTEAFSEYLVNPEKDEKKRRMYSKYIDNVYLED